MHVIWVTQCPENFLQFSRRRFSTMVLKLALTFLDDIMTLDRLSLKHIGHVRKVLTLLRTAGATLKLKNVDFLQIQLTT